MTTSLVVLSLAVVGALVLMQNNILEALEWFKTTRGFKGPFLFALMFYPVQYPVFLCGYVPPSSPSSSARTPLRLAAYLRRRGVRRAGTWC